MKKLIFLILLTILAVSAAAFTNDVGKSHTYTRFNPTGMMGVDRSILIVTPTSIVLRPGMSRTARVALPRFGKFTWTTDSEAFRIMVGSNTDARIVEVQGLKVGQGIITVTDQKGQTAKINVFIKRR